MTATQARIAENTAPNAITTPTQDILGPGYTSRTLNLQDGDIATLVHHPSARNRLGAVLYVHGYVDYFFQTHIAEHFAEQGYDFYALDLRRYGRSLRPGDIPYFVTDLATYYEELDLAMEQIHSDGHERLVVLGHSTGGLITSLWLHDRRETMNVDALVLNSPWLDLQKSWFHRTVFTEVNDVVGRLRPRLVLPEGISSAFAKSIHKDHHGEWRYNTDWKPIHPGSIRAGWFRAIRRGHARLHRGLDVRVPVLTMHSGKSLLGLEEWTPEAMTADTVLDVEQIARWAPSIGRNVTTVTIEDGLHDLFLSVAPVRQKAFEVMDTWLGTLQ